MTEDGPQPLTKQPAFIAVHHGPATRAWCGPLLPVLLGGLSVFFACCSFLGCVWGEKHKTLELKGQLQYLYLIRTSLTFPSRVCVDMSHVTHSSSSKDR